MDSIAQAMDEIEPPRTITYRPVGMVRSPFTELRDMPLQSVAAGEVHGRIELFPEYAPGLSDLDGFSHVHLLVHLHRGSPGAMRIKPFLDDTERGIFATRSPRHPNPIGLSVVRLLAIRGAIVEISGVDLLDRTPVLDINHTCRSSTRSRRRRPVGSKARPNACTESAPKATSTSPSGRPGA